MPVGGREVASSFIKGSVRKSSCLPQLLQAVCLTVSAWFNVAASVCSLNQALPVFSDGRQKNLFYYLFAASIYLLLDSFFSIFTCYIFNKVIHSLDCIEQVSSCLASAEGPGDNPLRILRGKYVLGS